MKKFFYTSIILLVLVITNCTAQQVTLKFNLPKGSSYDYNMNLDMSIKGNAGGQPIDVTNNMGMSYHFTTLDDSAGWKKMSSTISKIAMTVNTGGVNINYDSDQPVDTSNQMTSAMGKTLGAIVGSHFVFIMNDTGKIGYVSGINEMMGKIGSSSENNSMAAGMSGAFNEQNFKQNMQQAFGAYPNKPVKPGDSWTTTTTTDNNGVSMKMDNTYTLESVTDNNANVKVDSKISSDNSMIPINGTMTGTLQYDLPTGVPVAGDLQTKMSMEISEGGQTIPMNMDMKMKITGKKS